MDTKKERYLEAFWYFSVFFFFYIWFSRIHPLVVYDADDWTYLAYVRKTTPIWGDWNPAKVFPEVVMPFLSTIILHTLVPLTGDYITGFTVGHALIVSGFITAYAWCLANLVRRVFAHSRLTAGLISALFLILHFLVFRTADWNNSYLFRCEDLNCYYNYLIPALLNACIVMLMMHNPRFDQFLLNGNPAAKGLFYAALYLALFSNLVVSGILAAYAGCQLLLSLLKDLKKFRLKDYIKGNTVHLTVLLFWFISAVFELSGGRAASSSTHSLFYRIRETAYLLKDLLFCCNPYFWLVVIVICAGAFLSLLLTRHKEADEKHLLKHLLSICIGGAALLVYMLILCALVSSYYIYRSEYSFPLFFYGFLIVLLSLGYLLKKHPALLVILPLLLLFLVGEINTNGKTFEDSIFSSYGPAVCADISRDILNQYLEADAAGLDETIIYVPMHTADPVNDDNWPHSIVLLHRISNCLYEQGILSRPIQATFVADPAFNARHHIPVPQNG